MPPKTFQLRAGYNYHRFDGVIFRAGADTNPAEEVWKCGHGHETPDQADECAQDRLGRLTDELIPGVGD